MNSIAQCFAQNVRFYRQQQGWTQSELASRCGLSAAFRQSVESAKRWVGPTTVATLASCLGVAESDLFVSEAERRVDTVREFQAQDP